MTTVNKPDVVAELAQRMGTTKASMERFLNCFQDIVTENLVEGNEVKLSNFLAFTPTTRAPRQVRTPGAKENIVVPASRTLRVRPMKALLAKLRAS